MSRKLQTFTFTLFFTVPHASRCFLSLFIRVMHHFHILNFMNFILFRLKFKPKTKVHKVRTSQLWSTNLGTNGPSWKLGRRFSAVLCERAMRIIQGSSRSFWYSI